LFGYVKINKQELLVKDYETYRGVYCGLCKSLGRNYTVFSRFSLNYDFTFYALLLLALSENEPDFAMRGCLFNPLCRKKCCKKNAALDRAADASVLTVYAKLCDNVSDSRGIKKALAKLTQACYRPLMKKAKVRAPEVWELLRSYLSDQQEAEKQNAGVDAAAEPTARFMQELLSLSSEDENTARILRELGYHIGKWIYVCDAVDDRKKDIRSGAFNPVVREYGEQWLENAEPLLNTCIGEAAKALDLLTVGRFTYILKNIIYIGMPTEQGRVLSHAKEK